MHGMYAFGFRRINAKGVLHICNTPSCCLFLSCVDLGQAAFAGFTETVVQIDAGLMHGPADHVVADVTGAGEEIA